MGLDQILHLCGITLFTGFFVLIVYWAMAIVAADYRKSDYHVKKTKEIMKKVSDKEKIVCKKVLYESTNRHQRSIIASSLKQTLDEEIERLQHISDSIKLVQQIPRHLTPNLDTSFMSDDETSGLRFGDQRNIFGKILDINVKDCKDEPKKQALHSKICKTWGAYTLKRLRGNDGKKRKTRINRWQYLLFKNLIKEQFIGRQYYECCTSKHSANLIYLNECKYLKSPNMIDLSSKSPCTYIDSMNKQNELFHQLPVKSDMGTRQINLKSTFKSTFFSFQNDSLRQSSNKIPNNKSVVKKTIIKKTIICKKPIYKLKCNHGFKGTICKTNEIQTNKYIDLTNISSQIFRVPILINKNKVILKFSIHLVKSHTNGHKGYSHSFYTAGKLNKLQPIAKDCISDKYCKTQQKVSSYNRRNHHKRHRLYSNTSISQFESCKTCNHLDDHVSFPLIGNKQLHLNSVKICDAETLCDTKRITLKYYSGNLSEARFEETLITSIGLAKDCFMDNSDLSYEYFSQVNDHVISDKTYLSSTEEDLMKGVYEHFDQTNEEIFDNLENSLDVGNLICTDIIPRKEEFSLIKINKEEKLLPTCNKTIMLDFKNLKNKVHYNSKQDEISQSIEEITSIIGLDVQINGCDLGNEQFEPKTLTSVFEFKSFYQTNFDIPRPLITLANSSNTIINRNKENLSEIEAFHDIANLCLKKMYLNIEEFSCVDSDCVRHGNDHTMPCNNAVYSLKESKMEKEPLFGAHKHTSSNESVKYPLTLVKQIDGKNQHSSSNIESELFCSITDYFKDVFLNEQSSHLLFKDIELPKPSDFQTDRYKIEENIIDVNNVKC